MKTNKTFGKTTNTKENENQKSLRENQQNKVFKGFRSTLGYGFVFFSLLVFPKVLNKTTKKPSENHKYQRKQNKTLGNTKKTKFLKVSDPPLDMLFFCFHECCFVFAVFPKVFWFSKNLRENNKKQKNKPISKGGSETFKKNVFVGFPEGFLGFLWFSLFCLVFPMVFWFSNNLRENKQNKKNKPISKGGSETFKNFVFLVFPNVCLVFFGFLLYCWFSRSFFKVVSMLRF